LAGLLLFLCATRVSRGATREPTEQGRESARKNWAEFGADPEWQQVAKASEADGKIVEKIDSTFMDPTDYSPMK